MSIKATMTEEGTAEGLRDALEALEALAEDYTAPDLAERARQAREPLERGEIWVVVVGQFKRGKSTLLNALLGESVLPTGVVPVTSVVTHLRWAARPTLRVVFKDGQETTAPQGSLSEFVSEKGNAGNHKGVSLVEVGLPVPLLRNGLVLVDTPGIGSLDARATGRAYSFLPRVDAAILVLSPDPPMGEAEGAYLEALLEHTRHFLFVLNKIDLFPEEAWREAVAFNRGELAKVQGVAAEAIELLPVSSVTGLEGDEAGIGKLRRGFRARHRERGDLAGEEAGIGQLRTQLLDLVRERGDQVSREAAVRRLRAIAGELAARLHVEEKAIRLSDTKLEDRLSRLGELRRELALRREEIRPVLRDASRRLSERAGVSLRIWVENVRADLVESMVRSVGEHPELGNAALVRSLSDRLQTDVSTTFDAWWAGNEDDLRDRLREAMTRAAKAVDATGSTLSAWVEEELGVVLPTPPSPVDLADSHDFYYHVQGMKPELTVDLLGLLLPRSFFRWRLHRKTPRLVAEDLERNVGRIQGDLLYRAQETVRAFFAELERRAVAAEEGIEKALVRASRAHAGAREEGAAALERLARGTGTLEVLVGAARTDTPPSDNSELATVRESATFDGGEEDEE